MQLNYINIIKFERGLTTTIKIMEQQEFLYTNIILQNLQNLWSHEQKKIKFNFRGEIHSSS